MLKRPIINKSRDFIVNLRNGLQNTICEEIYYSFIISAFILIKESLIKKDNSSDTIYFDYDKNKEYIPLIENLAWPFIAHKAYEVNNIKVVIISDDDTVNYDENLALSLWILNKMRDTFAHGAYDIDYNNGTIKLKNDKTDGKFKQGFVKVRGGIQTSDGKHSISFDSYSLCDKRTYKLVDDLNIEYLLSFISGFDKGEEIIDRTFFKTREESGNIYEATDSYFTFGGGGIIKIDKDENELKLLNLKDSLLIDELVKIINIMSSFINGKTSDEKLLLIYLYNYMQSFFSLIGSDLSQNKILGFIKSKDFTIKSDIIEFNEIKPKIFEEYIRLISRLIIRLKYFKNSSRENEAGRKLLEDFSNNVLDKKQSLKNRIIVRTLRNGSEHVNMNIDEGVIEISDKNDNNSDDSKINLLGTIDSYLIMMKQLEEITYIKSKEDFDEFYEECQGYDVSDIETLIDNDTLFKSLISTIKCMAKVFYDTELTFDRTEHKKKLGR